jgi:hypothetical protein
VPIRSTGITRVVFETMCFANRRNKGYAKVLSALLEDEYFLYQIADHENLSKEALNCSLQNFINKSDNKVGEAKNGKLHADK